MIQIDDAGSGSLIGGTGIGIMRINTQEYMFNVIPLYLFTDHHFNSKHYQRYVINMVKDSFRKMNVTQEESICVCRGYIFDRLREWLSKEGYQWQSTKIEGLLQYKVEQSFNEYVIELGLPRNFVQHARYAFGFHRLLKWVFADYDKRAKLCKSGWKSWIKWSQVPINYTIKTATKEVYCLKCGQLIRKGEKIISLEYETNKPWNIDLHNYCSTNNTLYSNGVKVSQK